MLPNVTPIDRLLAICLASAMACCVCATAFGIHAAISKHSERRRIQGQPLIWWTPTLMFTGSCVGAWIADNREYYLHEVVGGMGGFGLLFGLAMGHLHGFFNLLRYRPSETHDSESSFDSSAATLAPVALDPSQTDNPYAPPRTK